MKSLRLLALLSAAAAAQEPAAPAEEQAKALADGVRDALKGKDDDAKKKAIYAAWDCRHPLTATALGLAMNDPSLEVKLEAIVGLGKMKGLAEAAKPLNAAFPTSQKTMKVFFAILKAMPGVNHPSSVPVLKAWVLKKLPEKDDTENFEIGEVLRAMGALKWKASYEALMDLAKKQGSAGSSKQTFQVNTLNVTVVAMGTLAGRAFNSAIEAEVWWEKNAKGLKDDMTPK
jgi:hypothetical protein